MKKIFCLLIIIVTLFVSCCCVSAAEVVSDGVINQEALDYLTGCVKKLPTNTNYYLYRTSDLGASLIYSNDLSYDSLEGVISGTDLTKISYIKLFSEELPYVTEEHLSSLQLNSSVYSIAYSSLGHWSTVEDKNTSNLTYILWTVILLLLVFVGFKFIRNRRSYISL